MIHINANNFKSLQTSFFYRCIEREESEYEKEEKKRYISSIISSYHVTYFHGKREIIEEVGWARP
jgi:hypothetical protein